MTGRQWADLACATEGDEFGDELSIWEHLTDWAVELGAVDGVPTEWVQGI